MLLLFDIQNQIYEKLIYYALNASDAVMAVYCDRPDPIETVEEQIKRTSEFLPWFTITENVLERWKELEQEQRQDVTLFEQVRQPFIKALSPYLIKSRDACEWPSTIVGSSNSIYTAAVYRSCKEIYPLLLQPGSYFSWRYPRYPEDLSFFKNNRCWLYASSHEEYIEFLPRSQAEYNAVVSLGIELPEPYHPIEDSVYYWEDYSL